MDPPRLGAADLADYADAVVALGQQAGLDRVGVASASPFTRTREVLEDRSADGLNGSMQFTYRNPARSTEPARVVPGARALVVGAMAYAVSLDEDTRSTRPRARIARYARRDRYADLRGALGVVAARLRDDGWTARVVADDNALVDRAAAHRAGLGWWGRNSNLLAPGLGSWFVLGSVVTDAPLPSSPAPVADGCGSCTRCIEGCPTGAIVGPGVVDARRCLAWLLQDTGPFPVEFRAALGDRLYGCDECQEVCPPSRRAVSVRVGPETSAVARADGATVDLLEVLDATDDDLLERFGRWYIPERDPRYLRRNALVVLGNATDLVVGDEVRRILRHYLTGPDELLAEHAGWAAARLGCEDLVADPASL